jgi:8-oxo-dGTP pyrophosphatase MutT (NUDIX family)
VDLIPDFSKAVRLCSYEDSRATDAQPLRYVPCYAEDIERQELAQKRKILSFIGRDIAVSVMCLLITVLLEFASGYLQDALDLQLDIATPVFGAIETILFLLLSEAFSVLIQKAYSGFPSLSEALGNVFGLLRDAIQTFGWKITTRPSGTQSGFRETPARAAPMRYIVPSALSRYLAMAHSNSSDFSESDIYPIANVDNPKVLEKIIRQEEISLEEFGLVYKSPFNILLADPIVTPDSGDGTSRVFFSYERVLPTSGNGVVIATIHQGKFVLLKQYRHALRSYQLSFPRGFAEPGADGREDVLRELSEELHAIPSKEPHFIGKIAPDSGLTSRVTEVYSVCIESFCQTHQEGIAEVIEVDATELARLISTGDINDGYTIGAFVLWQLGNKASHEAPVA